MEKPKIFQQTDRSSNFSRIERKNIYLFTWSKYLRTVTTVWRRPNCRAKRRSGVLRRARALRGGERDEDISNTICVQRSRLPIRYTCTNPIGCLFPFIYFFLFLGCDIRGLLKYARWDGLAQWKCKFHWAQIVDEQNPIWVYNLFRCDCKNVYMYTHTMLL